MAKGPFWAIHLRWLSLTESVIGNVQWNSAYTIFNNLTYLLFTAAAAAGSAVSCEEFCTFLVFLVSLMLLPVGSGRSLTDLRDRLSPRSSTYTTRYMKHGEFNSLKQQNWTTTITVSNRSHVTSYLHSTVTYHFITYTVSHKNDSTLKWHSSKL